MDGHFLFSVVYKDEIFYNLVGAAVEVLGIINYSYHTLLRRFTGKKC